MPCELDSTLYVIDVATRAVTGTIVAGQFSNGVVVSPDGQRVYVSNGRGASVSVIDVEDMNDKQIERIADALRGVPGLSVVQTGTPGQLTSVFLRGLPSQDMQVLLNGIPINQGLAGQFDFANLATDNIGRIEVARGP